jgi:hypothetical protein
MYELPDLGDSFPNTTVTIVVNPVELLCIATGAGADTAGVPAELFMLNCLSGDKALLGSANAASTTATKQQINLRMLFISDSPKEPLTDEVTRKRRAKLVIGPVRSPG